MTALLLDRVKMTTATTGTGTITLGSAVSPYQSFADANAVDGATYYYLIEDGSDWEIGTGVYTASGKTLARTIISSRISGTTGTTELTLSGSATIAVVAPTAALTPVSIAAPIVGLSAFSRAAATRGNVYIPTVNATLSNFSVILDTVAGAVYKVGIAQFNTTTRKLTTTPTYSATYTEGGTGKTATIITFNVAAGFSFVAGTTYVIFITRTDSTAAATLSSYYINGGWYFPYLQCVVTSGTGLNTFWDATTTPPSTGDTWTSETGVYWIFPSP